VRLGYRYAVLGSGRQGVALAYDLARNGEAELVRLVDVDGKVAARAARRLQKLLPRSKCRFEAGACDVERRKDVHAALADAQTALSAVPYRFNARLAAWAIERGVSFLDLGGNTAVVRAELALHRRAARAKASIVPDCGLAPGLGNHLVAHALASMDEPRHAHVRCGGLPERPVGPLGYKLVFNFHGLWNEYRGEAEFLRGGEVVRVPTLTEPEAFDSPELGMLEACVTSGGTSTCPRTWKGVLESFDYKTIRHPGHWDRIRALFELGYMDEECVARDGTRFAPLALSKELFESRLAFEKVRDIVILRVVVRGAHRGRPLELRYDLFDRHDARTGFTAMERTTAFPAALVAHMQARGLVEPGARPLETSVPALRYFDELPAHGIHVRLARVAGSRAPRARD
jgi:lysine 6-dehydrogenase